MNNHTTLKMIKNLFHQQGQHTYGEGISQMSHMVQSAEIAKSEGLDDECIIAAGLHDIGHLFEYDDSFSMQGFGHKQHDKLAARFLIEHGFSARIATLVAEHVNAKRYLCATDAVYLQTLSEASVHTMRFQGGIMSVEEAQAYQQTPHLDAILHIRRIDDQAKETVEHHVMPEWFWQRVSAHLAL